MQKFKIITLGCKVNQAESAGIARQLRDRYAAAEADDEPVNLCIINTCTVTGKASMQSRQAVRQALRAYPDARIVVTGCYAQTAPDEINSIPGVDLILGNDGKHRMVEEIGRQSVDSLKMIPESASPRMNHWIPGSPQEDRVSNGPCLVRRSQGSFSANRPTAVRSLPQSGACRRFPGSGRRPVCC